MMTDILTVAIKELREIFSFGDARGRSKFSLLIFIVIFGIVIPLQTGREWMRSSASAMVWAWMPFLWVSGVVADLFAGERERHTLEALLATRLSDQAILFGKLLAAMTYGFILTWVIMLVSAVTINLSSIRDGLLFYSPQMSLVALMVSILVSGLSASIGVLVSLRAGSARQAQQMMSAGMMVLLLPFLLLRFVPVAWIRYFEGIAAKSSPVQIVGYLVLTLVVIEAILIAIAMRLFQRSKLILD